MPGLLGKKVGMMSVFGADGKNIPCTVIEAGPCAVTQVKTVKATGAIVSGPIPLPTHKRIFTVNRSTFVNKKSREQFQLSSYKRLIDIYSSTAKTVDALMKLELPSGVAVEIKVY